MSTKVQLSPLQEKILLDRYVLKDAEGKPLESTAEEMWARVAKAIAQVEFKNQRAQIEEEFKWLLGDFRFVPGGRILASAGTGQAVTPYNCFVIPSPHDSRGGILERVKDLVEIQSRGGGVGINLSSLRPSGSYVKGVNGTSSGPMAWAEVFSTATGSVIQGGSRRGATMIMIDDWHPDVFEFINVKRDLSKITNANLSVCVSDRFMEAVKQDADWDLIFPDLNDPDYDELWDGNIYRWRYELKKPVIIYKTVPAREIWDAICQAAWASGEPGVVFMERYQKWSNTWYCEEIRCVNPCGEQGLGPWGVCLLGSINLTRFVNRSVKNKGFDWDSLKRAVALAVRFLDNVIDHPDTEYIHDEIRLAQKEGIRRMGLGTMGLADALIMLGIRYGSDEAVALTEEIYRTIRDAAYAASIELAKERGPFPRFERDKYLQGRFIQNLPEELRKGIHKHGIRNGLLLSQAPTGTTSLLANVSSGIEPVFAFVHTRRDRTGTHTIVHPLLEQWRKENPGKPEPDYFVAADDLAPEEHARMQAAAQKYVDSSISKTVNAPQDHTVDEVKTLYTLAYELGCKGVTYFRDGSRDAVLIRDGDKDKQARKDERIIKPQVRPDVVSGSTLRQPTPLGNMFVTLNQVDGKPFEVFAQIGKAGSDVGAFTEAIARLISLALRSGVDINEIIEQLSGIRGFDSLGFGPERVLSVPDAIGLALERLAYRQPEQQATELKNGVVAATPAGSSAGGANGNRNGNFCRDCGNPLVFEEGCFKCYGCGHSEC